MRLLLATALLAILAACSTPPTPYAAAGGPQSFGYYDEQIDANTWRVQFAGNRQTARGTVEDYLLFRSAEIAVGQGYQGFALLEDTIDKNVYYRGGTSFPGGVAIGSGGRFTSSSSVFLGGGFGTTYLNPQNAFTGYARIRLFNERAPEGLEAYDAEAILRVIGPKIQRPAPGS